MSKDYWFPLLLMEREQSETVQFSASHTLSIETVSLRGYGLAVQVVQWFKGEIEPLAAKEVLEKGEVLMLVLTCVWF